MSTGGMRPGGDSTDRRSEGALLGGLVAALGLSLFAQHLITPLGESRRYVPMSGDWASLGFGLLILAGLLGAIVVLVVERARMRAPSLSSWGGVPADVVGLDTSPSAGLLAASVACVMGSSALLLADGESALAIYPWAVGLVLSVLSCWHRTERPSGRIPRGEIVFLGVTLAVAVGLRLWNLGAIPPEVHGDEAACGLEARRILNGDVSNLLGIGWYDIPYLSFAISASFMALFGDDLFGLRTASVFQGVASIAVLFFLVRRLYGPRVAGLAALLLALSNWHVHFSRIGTDYMQASFATLLALSLFVRARQEGRLLDWALTGLGVGLAVSVYHAGRVVVVMLAVFLGIEWLLDRSRVERSGRGLAMMAVAAILFVAPTMMVLARWPSSISERSQDVFVLSERNLRHTYASTQVDDPAHVLALQVYRSVAAFNWLGERSGQHAHRAPLLDFWSGPIFAVGLIAFTLSAWRRRHRLLGIWFWSNFLLGSVLTVDAMFSPRMIVGLPAVFVFAALVIDLGWSLATTVFGRAGSRAAGVVVVAFFVLSAGANFDDYFRLHVREMQPAGPTTQLARFIADIHGDYRVYVLGQYRLGYDTLRFLLPGADAIDLGDEVVEVPPLDVSPRKGAAFIVDATWDGREAARASIVGAYPGARHSTIERAGGRVAFEVYTVEPTDIAR